MGLDEVKGINLKMKIGIFGGCFNPPHKMHKKIALNLIKNDYLDKIIFVPTGNLYQKKELISDEKRLQMIQLMIQDQQSLEVSNYEFGKLTYTNQTLKYFKKKYPEDELYFICGSDNLSEFDTWKEYQWILTHFKLLVIKRNQDNIDRILKKYDEYRSNILITSLEENNLSSTMIREMIRHGKIEQIKESLDENVYQFIKEMNLYLPKK